MARPKARLERPVVEDLFVPAVTSEHTEMYLKAIWAIQERGESPAKINTISKLLKVAAPSVVQMLRRLEEHGFIDYLARRGARFTKEGKDIGSRMVRNTRLVEALMASKFKIDVDERVACGIEHHMTEEFADSLCTLLKHPRKCPHGYPIPKGKCCPA